VIEKFKVPVDARSLQIGSASQEYLRLDANRCAVNRGTPGKDSGDSFMLTRPVPITVQAGFVERLAYNV